MTASCQDQAAHAALDALLAGEVAADDLLVLRQHLQGCEACREQYDRITRTQARLEKSPSGLPAGRLAFLEQQVLARTAAADAQRHPEAAGARFWRWLLPAFGAVTAGAVGLVLFLSGPVPPEVEVDPGVYQARGGSGDTFGVRAFCVTRAGGEIQGAAGPGETLACPQGNAVSFAYTAPKAATLTIAAGPELEFLSEADPGARIKPGVDVPLDFSTPVGERWLTGPVEVKARFLDPQSGKVLGESKLTLKP